MTTCPPTWTLYLASPWILIRVLCGALPVRKSIPVCTLSLLQQSTLRFHPRWPSSGFRPLSRPTRASVLSSHIESVVAAVRPPSLPSLPLYTAPRRLSVCFALPCKISPARPAVSRRSSPTLYPLCCTRNSQATQRCPSY